MTDTPRPTEPLMAFRRWVFNEFGIQAEGAWTAEFDRLLDAALVSSPAPAGPTPDDMADIMQAATGGPDFTIKDWPPAPAVLDGQPRTPEGIALWHRGSANWSEGDWYAKFGASIRAVEDAALASSPAPARFRDALEFIAKNADEWTGSRAAVEARSALAASPAPAGLRDGLRAVLRDFDREPTEEYLDEAERIFRAAARAAEPEKQRMTDTPRPTEPLTRGAMLKALVEEVRYRRGRLTRITADDYELILTALASSPAGLDECVYGSEEAHPGGSDWCLTHGIERGEHRGAATRPAEPAMTPRDKEAAIIGGPFYSSRDPGKRSRT